MRIGIDLGGTKTEGLILDADGRERHRVRIPTPRHDYDATLRGIAGVVESLEQAAGARATVGLGIPGAPSPSTGLVKNANSTWLNGRPLQADLEHLLQRPVRLANDANCFALSEAVDGAAAGADVVFGVILGTGCGGGVVVHRRVLAGPNALAGEWGHNPLPWPEPGEWPGPPCYCGRTGCIETFLSGPAVAADHQRSTLFEDPHGSTRSNTAGPADVREVVRLAAEDPEGPAAACVARYEERLARALTAIINILDPDVIVLGGGLSNIERLYANVPPLFRPFGGEPARTRLVRAMHGDSSGVRGAAWLWTGPSGPSGPMGPAGPIAPNVYFPR